MADKVTNKAVNDWLRGVPPPATDPAAKPPVPKANAGSGAGQTQAFAVKVNMNEFMRNAKRVSK